MVLKSDDIWGQVLDIIEKELNPVSFGTWFKVTELYELDEKKIILQVPMPLHKKWLLSNYYDLINESFIKVTGKEREIECLLKEEIETPDNLLLEEVVNNKEVINNNKEAIFETNLDKSLNFDNFIVGATNKFARTAAYAVAQKPGDGYNPLFIYGKSGLGKTHLMHAIGNYITENSNLKVLYTTSADFRNDYTGIAKTANNSIDYATEFKNKYRNIDVLIIDDIQYLVGAEKTQEEFFHTFNDLYQYNKQIVLTSDRNPKELTELEDRLKSRFQSGLIQDLQSPDYETRLAILEKKVEIEQYKVNHDALVLIAERVDTNIRELEGILQKVCFHSTLMSKTEADVLDVMDSLNEKIETDKSALTLDKICEIVADYYNISLDNLKSKKRSKEFVEPRQMAIYLICEFLPDVPLASIGMFFNGRDHTTIIHSRDKVEQNIKAYTKIKNQFNDLKTIIYRL